MAAGETVEKGRLWRQVLHKLRPHAAVSLDLVAQADALRLQGDLGQAEALCSLVLTEYPGYASAHVVMGEIRREQGEPAAAEAAWEQARRIHPEHPRANLRLAQLYLSRGEVARAMAMLEPALLTNAGSLQAARLARQAQQGPARAAQEGWLTPERSGELVEAVAACNSVVTARLVNAKGEVVAGEARRGGTEAATLLLGSRPLLERVGAGGLRAAFVQGTEGRCAVHEVCGYCLVADLTPEATPSRVRSELQAVVAALRHGWDGPEVRDAQPNSA